MPHILDGQYGEGSVTGASYMIVGADQDKNKTKFGGSVLNDFNITHGGWERWRGILWFIPYGIDILPQAHRYHGCRLEKMMTHYLTIDDVWQERWRNYPK